jgi:hypothetical protein
MDCCLTPIPPLKAPGTAQLSVVNRVIELISPSNKSYESWVGSRTEVRTIMIDPRQAEIISELMDYQPSVDPAGVF